MRVLGIVLIVLAAAAAVPATLTWLGYRSDAAESERNLQELEAQRDATIKELYDTNLRYRGYQKSVPQIPDSIRAAESAIISSRFKDFNKQVTALEIKEREENLTLQRIRSKRSARAAEAKQAMIPFAAAALVLLLAGALVMRRA